MFKNLLLGDSEKLVAKHKQELGKGRTERLSHNSGFPTSGLIELAVHGLLADASGKDDILSRAELVSEDSKYELLEAHLKIVLRARLFKLLAAAAPEFLEATPASTNTNTALNTLYRLMVEKSDVILSHDEMQSITTGINLLNGSNSTTGPFTKDDVFKAALYLIGSTNHTQFTSKSTISIRQGLVPVINKRGISLAFVPLNEDNS